MAGFEVTIEVWPAKDYSWEELEKISAKVEGLWTWPNAALLWLKAQGIEVKDIESFDYHKFIENGGRYLIDEYGKEVGEAQITHSDIDQERRIAKEFIKKVEVIKSIPTLTDMKNLLSVGHLVKLPRPARTAILLTNSPSAKSERLLV